MKHFDGAVYTSKVSSHCQKKKRNKATQFYNINHACVVKTLKQKRLASSAVYSLYSISRFHFHSSISSSISGYLFSREIFPFRWTNIFFLISFCYHVSLISLHPFSFSHIQSFNLCFLFIFCPFHLLQFFQVISILSGLLLICSYLSLIVYFLVNLHYTTYDIDY